MNRKQLAVERPFRRRVKALLDAQYRLCADHVRQGVVDVDHVVTSQRGLLLKAFSEHYTRCAQLFFDSVYASFWRQAKGEQGPREKKGMAEEFWQAFHRWASVLTAQHVKDVSEATRRMIRRVVRTQQNAGASYGVIADAIEGKAADVNGGRALRIARTETHVASTFAVNEAVRSTRVKFEREWVSMADDRVRPAPGTKPPYNRWDHRKANGQRRGMDEPFDVSGEKLRFPGDPRGSAGNVIGCR